MSNEWKLTSKDLPSPLDDVLFVVNNGEIYKGFVNPNGVWFIQNDNALISSHIKNSDNVIAWTNLPNVDEAGWRTKEDEAPEIYSRVLIKDRMTDEITIAYITKNIWIIRNTAKDYLTFWANMNSPWMPLPEIPDNIKVLMTKKD